MFVIFWYIFAGHFVYFQIWRSKRHISAWQHPFLDSAGPSYPKNTCCQKLTTNALTILLYWKWNQTNIRMQNRTINKEFDFWGLQKLAQLKNMFPDIIEGCFCQKNLCILFVRCGVTFYTESDGLSCTSVGGYIIYIYS